MEQGAWHVGRLHTEGSLQKLSICCVAEGAREPSRGPSDPFLPPKQQALQCSGFKMLWRLVDSKGTGSI